ncbi:MULTISPECIES: fumarylacetoacetate hydrolase family protein [unclassified Enterobacter]|jgi:2-keto-4-pentenoate hydratase/2-oxohepta-3-ene-1,7-dioic acid hydratase in catechol pathway|uniref:fumarylacetoacetate hydrolase family protein n=1 Tax=unclassified Enterobacter TaxID=2608935 RepID=UPI0012AE47FB|nr:MULTISPECIES: fumarylacetoacetate hydrolase family protein [unclassified Enterobacter]MBB3303724.1 2-keto-4-pentenoate hydratase/2-oxohepta-3-ene-1,7-dioic acid hydratase in catechol pathway [Enterobacter sp. Sphag1F]MRT23702.1 fumarylacetoacetate hydrolase family protein [Enterobacteriaceae bacterium RIT697]NYI13171.1 2-keto-4-pentenoate hydratase/2-oxohepta-3-ene-1,7-dioic acid hydratase in catechol pathway [Enterobacter sp. Sphag71]
MYQHRNWQGALLDYPVSKVVCVGSNYAKHIKEMGSATPTEPVVFIKPETAVCDLRQPLSIPANFGEVHHEVELAVLIGSTLKQASEEHVAKAIAGYGVALDLTLRDVQAGLKKAGQPWEKSKGFDNSCPLSGFIPVSEFSGDPQNTELKLIVNGEVRQHGTTADMIHKILPLIAYMSQYFTLRAGDVVLTGTPEGVGPMRSGDKLEITLAGHGISTRVL